MARGVPPSRSRRPDEAEQARIVAMIRDGLTNAEIGAALGRSGNQMSWWICALRLGERAGVTPGQRLSIAGRKRLAAKHAVETLTPGQEATLRRLWGAYETNWRIGKALGLSEDRVKREAARLDLPPRPMGAIMAATRERRLAEGLPLGGERDADAPARRLPPWQPGPIFAGEDVPPDELAARDSGRPVFIHPRCDGAPFLLEREARS